MTHKALRTLARETLAKAIRGEEVKPEMLAAAVQALNAPAFKGD